MVPALSRPDQRAPSSVGRPRAGDQSP